MQYCIGAFRVIKPSHRACHLNVDPWYGKHFAIFAVVDVRGARLRCRERRRRRFVGNNVKRGLKKGTNYCTIAFFSFQSRSHAMSWGGGTGGALSILFSTWGGGESRERRTLLYCVVVRMNNVRPPLAFHIRDACSLIERDCQLLAARLLFQRTTLQRTRQAMYSSGALGPSPLSSASHTLHLARFTASVVRVMVRLSFPFTTFTLSPRKRTIHRYGAPDQFWQMLQWHYTSHRRTVGPENDTLQASHGEHGGGRMHVTRQAQPDATRWGGGNGRRGRGGDGGGGRS